MVANRTTIFADGNVLTASQLNGEFNNLLNAPQIVNADISGSAAIAISKIATGISGSVVGTSDAQTLTDKRITRRVYTMADGVTIDVNSDLFDEVKQLNTQGAGTLTLNNPTGTPTDGQGVIYKIKASSAQTYAYGNQFKAGILTLPAGHAGSSKYDYMGFLWNSDSSTWDCVAVAQAIG